MNNKKDFIDLSLTPENAAEKGYKYIDDIIYEKDKPSVDIKNILELIEQHKYKLGAASEINEFNNIFGLYMPLGQKNTK